MEIALVILVSLMVVVILALVLMLSRSRQFDPARLDARLDSLNTKVGEVTQQSSTYQETLKDVHESLGGLTESSKRILEVGQDMRKLQDVLAAPTLRGGVGELLLENMLSQILPGDFYATQHTFKNGHRVDAVIRLANGLVPVDAKFPLEGFRRLAAAKGAERSSKLTEFRRDIRRHIDDIAEKYICPGETLDFALMYIPAENIYYEIILKEDGQDDILNYAWKRRVITISPNSFYAYLQVIALGLRGLQVEKDAKLMLDNLSRLRGDFDTFADDFRLTGTHLRRAQSKHDEGLPKLESIRRALPGQLTTVPVIQTPKEEESDEAAPEEGEEWHYSSYTKRRGRSHQSP